ncbi:MAG TPA: class I SAM-dependent methyltransferase [Chryseosolibacter sp.]
MASHSEKFYDRVAQLYPLIDFFLKPQKRKFFDLINSSPYGMLLEIGVGTGSHFKFYDNHAIIGVDTSPGMLTHARQHAKPNIQLLQMSGEDLSFPDQRFDYVVLSHVLAVVDNPDKLLAEVYRVLKPDGKVFILNHFTPDNWLKHIDRAFASVSNHFHFKSLFLLSNLHQLEKFTLVHATSAGPLSYFKILVYEKKV